MSDTIAYDRSVKDYIPELSATGHVTHTGHTKSSVTLHHNGGRLSFESILATWKTRPASAHFDVDAAGNVAQFVKVTEYAWAVGNTTGNQDTISIEMCNETLAPQWKVADVTLASATRLAGWLFANVIKAAPSSSNFFPHSHWSATDCPGPYVKAEWAKLLADVTTAYHSFAGTHVAAPPSTAHETNAQVAAEVMAGKWGNNPGRATALTKAGYNAAAVQTIVNQLASGKKAPAPAKLTVDQLATQVIEGKWGNNPERAEKLKEAGYNAAAVQAEVNRRV